MRGSASPEAEAVRIALTLTEFALSPLLGLPLAPVRIARGAAGVVRPFRHYGVAVVLDYRDLGRTLVPHQAAVSAEGSNPASR